jgi:hypothetical protein
MEIRLTDSRGNLFAQVTTWEDANAAARAVFKRQTWSDIYYFIEFNSKQETHGSIDIEPHSFHTRHQREIFTKHLKTFWGNLANLDPQKAKIYGVNEEDKRFFKYLLTELPTHTTPII